MHAGFARGGRGFLLDPADHREALDHRAQVRSALELLGQVGAGLVRPLVIGDFKRIAADLGEIIEQVIREHPEIDLAKPDEHLPVILHKEDSIGAMDYADLTQNFIHHFEDIL